MFNLFPKKKPINQILEDAGLSEVRWNFPQQTPSYIQAQQEMIDELLKENIDLKNLLKSIEEDGTDEHNKAIKLREENVQLKETIKNWEKDWDIQNENIHKLEERNRELLEKYNGTVTMGGLKYMKAKLQIVQNNYKKCAEERDEYKHQLNAANKEIEALKKEKKESFEILKKAIEDESARFHKLVVEDTNNWINLKAANKEIEQLKRWKKEQLTVQSWWDKVDSYVRDHDDAPLGGFVANTCLNFLKERDEFKKQKSLWEEDALRYCKNADFWREQYEKNNLQITAFQKIIEGGKKTIDEQKKEIEKLKEDIQDYVIKKDDKISTLQKELNHMKAVAESAISLCDLSDKTDYDLAINELKNTQDWDETIESLKNMKIQGFEDYDPSDFVEMSYDQSVKITEMNAQKEAEQKNPMYPIHWGGHKKETSWEEVASDLSLKIIKLEKQIEELKILNTTLCQKPS